MFWTLNGDGRPIAEGSSDDSPGGGITAGSATRTIGQFQGQKGIQYRVEVDSLSDSTILAITEPKLTVNVGGTLYEFNLVVGSLVTRASAVVGGLGVFLLLSSFLLGRKDRARLDSVGS
jgi:hypothetical protein